MKKIFKTKDEEIEYRAIKMELLMAKRLEASKKPFGLAILEMDERYRWASWRCL